MRAGGSKQKGAGFERDVCKKLSLWVSEGKSDAIFWRSAMSGGRATVGQKQGIQRNTQVGDISAIDPIGAPFLDVFYVECKFYKDFMWAAYMLKQSGTLHRIWKDLCLKSFDTVVDKIPMLIGKQNGYPPFAIIPPFESLPETSLVYKDENFDWKTTGIVIPFDAFLEQTSVTDLIEVYKRGQFANLSGKKLMEKKHGKV